MASNYWGIPRSTHDLDFVLQLQTTNVADVVAAFQEGFFIQPEAVASALAPPYQFNALDEQSALKVDFWTLHNNAFEQCAFERRVTATLFDTPAWIATAEDVILHKLYWHKLTPSDRQLSDAAGVISVQGNSLDYSHLRRWATLLDATADLERLLSGSIRPKST
jgi:hypothetical protein